MSYMGKSIRLSRIFKERSGKAFIVAMDHAVTRGPLPGLTDPVRVVKDVVAGGADAIMMHEGAARKSYEIFRGKAALILKASGATRAGPDFTYHVPVSSVEHAVRLGADGIAVTLFVGSSHEPEMLSNLGEIAADCERSGMPLLAIMYPVEKEGEDKFDVDRVKVAARLGAELGADIVKTHYTGSAETFREVVKSCPAPVVIAGGPKLESVTDVFRCIEGALQAGAAGVTFGRNVWQYDDPKAIARAIAKMLHERASIDEAKKELSFNNA